MAITYTASNHAKYQKQLGNIRLKGQASNVSLTFANTPGTITFPANVSTYGLEVGDKIRTNSANAANVGPFYIKSISTVDATVMNADGSDPTLTAGTETGLTCGTYLVKCLLMRNGFVFNKDDHATLINLKTTTGAIALTFISATNKMTRGSGSFVTDGFVVGNYFTTDATLNPGPFTIASVSALEIVVNEAVADEGPVTKTATSNDELATGFGYTQDTKLTGAMTVTEDDVNDVGDAAFPTVTWSASGGSIGPTPSVCLVDEASPDNTILGNYDFGGNQTATDGTTFNLAAGILREA